MANLLEDLTQIAENLPPSHINIRLDQIPGVLAAAVHYVEDNGILKTLEHEEGPAIGVLDYFTKDAQAKNEQYLKDHPEAGSNQAGVISGPTYEELLRRVAALEGAQNAGNPPTAVASLPSSQTSQAGTDAAVSSTVPEAPPQAAAPAPAPASADPAGPSKAQQEAELIAQIQSAQAQLAALDPAAAQTLFDPATAQTPEASPATPSETPAPAPAPTTEPPSSSQP